MRSLEIPNMIHSKIIDFSKYSSIHIGPTIEVKIIDNIGKYDDFYIIGRANNLLVSNNPLSLAVLSDKFDYIKINGDKLIVGAATSSGKLLMFCKRNDIAGFEFLAKLPGSIGGLVKMNAGLKQWEIFELIESVKTKDGYIKKEDIKHSYRETQIDSIIYEVIFDIKKGFCKERLNSFLKLRANQPQIPSAGSCFKNPKGEYAGRLIDEVGLKGFKIGNMGFSEVHANFLVNYGGGIFEDAMQLISLAQKKVKEQFDISLETEIIILSNS